MTLFPNKVTIWGTGVKIWTWGFFLGVVGHNSTHKKWQKCLKKYISRRCWDHCIQPLYFLVKNRKIKWFVQGFLAELETYTKNTGLWLWFWCFPKHKTLHLVLFFLKLRLICIYRGGSSSSDLSNLEDLPQNWSSPSTSGCGWESATMGKLRNGKRGVSTEK